MPESGVHDLTCKWVCPGSGFVQIASPEEIAACTHSAHTCWCDEDDIDFVYASGEMTCMDCGKHYRNHPLSGPRSGIWPYEQFLNRLCSGQLVKL